MAEITTYENADGSVTTTVIEAGRRFESTVSPQEAAGITVAILESSAAARVAGCFSVGALGRMRDYKAPADFDWDMTPPAQRRGATKEQHWQALGADQRQRTRASFAAMLGEWPDYTPADALKRWQEIRPQSRERLREKYSKWYGDDFVSDAIDVVTLTPVLSKIPIVKEIHRATVQLHKAPFDALVSVAKGERIDKAALASFKKQLAAAKTLGPYAQTVVSMVPGIGTGVSAALGAGLALAEGKPIDQAVLAGVRGALPGGALAQMAFDAATAVMAGKPIEQVAISALPLNDAAKKALVEGAKIARAAAEGKRIDQAVLDSALTYLPPNVQRAAQVAIAVGSGKLAQQGLGPMVQALPASVVRGASVSKALDAAAKGLKAAAPAVASKLDATSKLNLSSMATMLGAPDSAAKLVNAAKKAAPSAGVLQSANEARKRILEANEQIGPTEIVKHARQGRVRSSRGGTVTPAELAAAYAAGRVFFVVS